MRSSFTVNTATGDDTYAYGDCTDTLTAAAISRFGRWLPVDVDGMPTVKCYLASAGVGNESFLGFLTWGQFRAVYKTGTQNNGRPVYFTIDPQNNLVLAPKPDGIYTLSGDYQRGVQVLAANGDTPDMPSRFHQLIVYDALAKYGGSLSAQEVLYRAEKEGGRLRRALERDQMPHVSMARPLA